MGVCDGVKDRLEDESVFSKFGLVQFSLAVLKIRNSLGDESPSINNELSEDMLFGLSEKLKRFFEGRSCSILRTFLSDDKKFKFPDFKSWNL
jgi:hypothetical protein